MNEKCFKALNAADCAEFLRKSAKSGKKALIIAHRNPDGDAVGSAFALKRVYKALGGKAECACTDKVPEYLSFLLNEKEGFVSENLESFDIKIAVDVASPSQFGELSYLADKTDIAIDHHGNCTPYCDSYRIPTASAAGELIYNILKILEEEGSIKAETDIFRLIYAAISADSGSFRYSNTTKETHIIAAELTERINSDKTGLSCADISRYLHDSKTLTELKAQSYCIENLTVTHNGKTAYVIINREKTEKAGLCDEDFGSAIDIPRCIKGVEIAFTVKETSEKGKNGLSVYRISARSNTDISVAKICAKYGGGGHEKAAGASIEAENSYEAANIICEEIKRALDKNEQKR